jgi:sec-independent protein translocase protein TatA
MPDLGGWEWVILAVVALVLFGGTKLADVGRNAGRAIREFKEETGGTNGSPAVAAPAPDRAGAVRDAAPAEKTLGS